MNIKNWASVICVVAIVSGILAVIIPDSKIKKAYNVLTISLLLYAFLLPFISKNFISFDFGEFLDKNERLKEEYNEEAFDIFEESAESVLEGEISTKLKNSGIVAEAEVECIVKEEKFYIDKILIICDKPDYSKEKIDEILDEFKTENTRVVIEGD